MSSGQILDLKTILPDDETVIFAVDGVQYKIKLFIPSAAALLVVNNSSLFQSLFIDGGISAKKEAIELVIRISEIIFMRDNPFMDSEWIRKNISFSKLLMIMSKILTSVFHYFDQKRDPETLESDGEMLNTEIAPILARVMSEYGLSLDYVLYGMTYPQVVMFYNEAIYKQTGKRKSVIIPEETDDEIRAQFVKKPDGGWTVKK